MKEKNGSKKDDESHSLSKGFFALVGLILILLFIQFTFANNPANLVKGAKTERVAQKENEKVEDAKERLSGTLDERLDDIKRQVTNLDPQDVVNSSPQVQKIIEDLKNLQGVPRNELKNACQSICDGL